MSLRLFLVAFLLLFLSCESDAPPESLNPPSAPTLAAPADGHTGSPTSTNLYWNPVANAVTYTLEVATDTGFGNPIVTAYGVRGTSYWVSGLAITSTYYWHVRAVSGGGTGPWSPVWAFTTGTVSCPPFDPDDHCSHACVGFVPLGDLAGDFYLGYQGGLYPGGSNTRPSVHNTAGLDIASTIGPLNAAGQPDPAGAIVLMSIGMSNTQQEFASFIDMVETLSGKNPALRVVNGAQGGWEINRIIDPNAEFWDTIDDIILPTEGLTPQQVQVIWFKEAEFQPAANATDTTFPGYPLELKEKFILAVQIAKDRYPNARLCYVSSRIYGGYDVTGGNPEPFAYYTGWAAKFMIEDQINGDTRLAYSGTMPQAPWLSWAVDLWADGLNPRSDGLIWICPDDFKEDGRHPSDPVGRIKVATMLLDFFLNDETTRPWFLENP
jgi:hypothetical protein